MEGISEVSGYLATVEAHPAVDFGRTRIVVKAVGIDCSRTRTGNFRHLCHPCDVPVRLSVCIRLFFLARSTKAGDFRGAGRHAGYQSDAMVLEIPEHAAVRSRAVGGNAA